MDRVALSVELVEKEKSFMCSVLLTPVWIITAYDPTLDPDRWDKDFKRRRITS